MCAVFKSDHKLRQSLMRVNTAVEEDAKKGVVYEVPCCNCEHVYIGGDWQESERLKEHQYTVKKENMQTGIATHAYQQQHSVDWDAAKVHCTEQEEEGS